MVLCTTVYPVETEPRQGVGRGIREGLSRKAMLKLSPKAKYNLVEYNYRQNIFAT